ncbi:MAG: hypothetical protein ACREQ5_35190, partial [Candidatus Dormibacteria bacterium]
MMSALRWSLLIVGVLFIAAREWWEWRRPRQAGATRTERGSAVPEGAEAARLREAAEPVRVREPPLQLPEIHARDSIADRPGEDAEAGDEACAAQDAPPPLAAAVPRESLPELPAAPAPLVE